MQFRKHCLVAAAIAATLPFAALTTQAWGSSHREAPNITRYPDGGFDRLLSLQQLRTGPGRLRHAARQLHPAAAAHMAVLTISPWTRRRCTRSTSTTTATRSENLTFQFRFTNRLANDNRGIKLNIGGPQVAVPLKNVGGVSAADNSRAQFPRELPDVAGSRRSPSRRCLAGDRRQRRHGVRQALRLRRHQDLRQRRRLPGLREFLHPHDQRAGLQHAGPRVRRASARKDSR